VTVVERVTDEDGVAVLRLHAPAVAAAAAPGTFVTVATPVALLRRPFWIAGADGDALTLRVRPVGAASAWLAGRRPGDDLDVLGPLGRAIDLPPPGGACVLAGPVGTPLLSWLAALLPARGVTVTLTPAGAAPAVRHALMTAALATTPERTAAPAAPVAAAGPAAAPARRPAAARRAAGGVWAPPAGAAVVPRRPEGVLLVAAGTPADQARVAAVAAEAGVRCLVPTQPAMACGIGVCWTCAVPVLDGAPIRGCLDGPVLDAARLARPPAAVAG